MNLLWWMASWFGGPAGIVTPPVLTPPANSTFPPAYFPHNYFAAYYFAPRYFPPSVTAATTLPGYHIIINNPNVGCASLSRMSPGPETEL